MKRLCLALCALAATLTSAHAESGGWLGGTVEIPDRQGGAMAAAGSVAIVGRVNGDALVAAGKMNLAGEVADDVRVMAGEYIQLGDVGGELAVASGKVEIDGVVGNDAYIAAEDVRMGFDARVGRNARIAGEDVLVKGRIDGDLDVAGETVAISAQIGGSVTVRARQIILGPDTTIEGDLNWRAASEPEIAPDAIIGGAVNGTVDQRWPKRGTWSFWGGAPRAAVFAGEFAGRLMVATSAFLVGLCLVLLTPHYADRAAAIVRGRWPAALAWGALFLFAAPLLGFVMLFTIIGIPLGLLTLLAYPLVLLWGYAAGAASLGRFALPGAPLRPRTRVLALGAGILALTVLAFVPLIGFLAGLAAVLVGLGALILAIGRPAAPAS